ncbi:MAG: diacylglycerol kinase family protein [Pseudomonadota bacterium]
MATSIYDFARLPGWQAAGRETAVSDLAPTTLAPHSGPAPRVGIIHNPRSHQNKLAAASHEDLKRDFGPNIHIAEPGDRSALPQALTNFAQQGIDLLAIDGGDGTVRDVLTCGYAAFGDKWPALAVLPRGKTNALAHDLRLPGEWDIDAAIRAYQLGAFAQRRPLALAEAGSQHKNGASAPVFGFVLGAGAFTKATQVGQSAHRLGAFNSLAVATTAIWALIQSVTATRANEWRRGAAMEIGIGPHNAPLGHSGHGDATHRQLLFAASLENMPAGINPFGAVQKAGPAQFKVLAIDQISRRTTALIPAMLLGLVTKGLRQRGVHQLAVSSLSLTLDEPFILDGEAFPAGEYSLASGPALRFVVP